MKIADLPNDVYDKINSWRYDRILEKHEGPEKWSSMLSGTEIMSVDGCNVLLPIPEEWMPNITILRSILSVDNNSLTIFLKDTTHSSSEYEFFEAGRVAVCDKIVGTDVFLAILYHEWFMEEQVGLRSESQSE